MRKAVSILLAGFAGLPLAGFMAPVSGAEPDGEAGTGSGMPHTHVPLEVDAGMGWAEVLEAALAIAPERFDLAGREAETAGWSRLGDNWLAAAPRVQIGAVDDDPLDARGQTEFDVALEMPLWRIGEKSAARDVAAGSGAETAAAADFLRLQIAGRLREVLWEIAGAGRALEQARQALEVTDELVRTVELRATHGDLPESDLLLARVTQYERNVAVIEAEAMVLDAERAFRSLTGLEARPANFAESRSDHEDTDPNHPVIALAMRELDRARARLDLVEKSSRGNPVLSIGPHRQQDPLGTYYNNSMVVGISLPLGGRNHGSVERAAATREVTLAQSNLASAERALDLAVHEAEHELFVIEESLELVEPQAELAARRLQMGRVAFEQGEIDLTELLRIQDAAIAASGEAERLRIDRQRGIASLNQALGELP
jgi:cobalt-zinc-cadmium efflux system outer membrane protein